MRVPQVSLRGLVGAYFDVCNILFWGCECTAYLQTSVAYTAAFGSRLGPVFQQFQLRTRERLSIRHPKHSFLLCALHAHTTRCLTLLVIGGAPTITLVAEQALLLSSIRELPQGQVPGRSKYPSSHICAHIIHTTIIPTNLMVS